MNEKITIGLSAIAVLLVITMFLYSLTNLAQFLTPNKVVEAKVLVVEGWLHDYDYMLSEVVAEIGRGAYEVVLISGIGDNSNSSTKGTKSYSIKSNADKCRDKLVERGVDNSLLHPVPAPRPKKHRTYNSAVAIKNWLVDHHVDAVNVYSSGTHGRKTFVIYRRVLGENIKTGIISCKIEHFESIRWWKSRKGTRITFGHLIGYVYALFCPFYEI